VFVGSDTASADLSARLSDIHYDDRAGEFIRYADDPTDVAVAALVRDERASSSETRERFRVSLDDDQVATLRLFAMRRVLQGRRSSSREPLGEALDAFALLPTLDDVPWDSWLKAVFFLATSLGGHPEELVERFDEFVDEAAATRVRVVAESMARVSSLSDCGLVEVTTTYGTGFVEILVFRGAPSRAFFGAPRQADHVVAFDPQSNLAQLSVLVADALASVDSLVTGPITQDQLPASVFSLSLPGSYVACRGCLSFVVTSHDGAVTVFVAELDEDARALSESANDLADQLAVSRGSRLVVLCAQPSFHDDATPPPVAHYRELVEKVLAESSSAIY